MGRAAEVDALMAHVDEICRQHGAWEIRVAQSEAERALVWKGRKAAFAAMGRISPNYIVQDGVIPRTSLPQILSEIEQLSTETGSPRRQRLSRRRRKSASAGPVRSPHPWSGKGCRAVVGTHS